MSTQAINIAYTTTSSVTFNAPVQQVTILDTTNYQYLRQMFVSNDGVKLVVGDNVILIPMAQLYAAAASYDPSLTWPPVIITQPSTGSVTSPGAVDFFISASSEITFSYQWQVMGNTSSSYVELPLPDSIWTGSTTDTLHISSSRGLDQSTYRCVLTNLSGQTTSSAALLYVF